MRNWPPPPTIREAVETIAAYLQEARIDSCSIRPGRHTIYLREKKEAPPPTATH